MEEGDNICKIGLMIADNKVKCLQNVKYGMDKILLM